MTGLVGGVVAFGLLAATALAAAATLRLRSLAEFALAAYLFAFGEAVLLVLVLSPFGAVERRVLLVGLAIPCVLAAYVWWRRGHPLPDVSGLRRVGALMRSDRIFWPLGGVVALALAYTVALIVGTPPNNGDSLAYHLARAAFWRQDGGIDYIPHSYDVRLNVFPPNTEAVLTLLMEVTRSERALGFVQFGSLLACAVAVFAARTTYPLLRARGDLRCPRLPDASDRPPASLDDEERSRRRGVSPRRDGLSRRRSPLAESCARRVGGRTCGRNQGDGLVRPPAPGRCRDRCSTGRAATAPAARAGGGHRSRVVLVRGQHRRGRARPGPGRGGGFNGDLRLPGEHPATVGTRPGHVRSLRCPRVGHIRLRARCCAVSRRRDPRAPRRRRVGVPRPYRPLRCGLSPRRSRRELPGSGTCSRRWTTISRPRTTNSPAWAGSPPPERAKASRGSGRLGSCCSSPPAQPAVVLARRRSLSRLALLFGLAPVVWLIIVAASLPYHPSYGRYFIFPVALSATLGASSSGCANGPGRSALSRRRHGSSRSSTSSRSHRVSACSKATSRRRSGAPTAGVCTSHPQPETPAEALRFLVTLPRHDSVALALGYNDLGYAGVRTALRATGRARSRRLRWPDQWTRCGSSRTRSRVGCDRRNVLASCGRVAGGLGRIPPAGRMPAVTVRRRASPARRPTRRGARRTSRRA